MKEFGYGKQSLEETINFEVKEVIAKLLSSNGEEVLMSGHFDVPVINTLWQLVAGSRFTPDDPEGMEMVAAIDLIFKNTLKVNMIPLKILKKFPSLADYETVVKAYDDMKRYIMKIIDEHERTYEQENPRDFIDVYLNEIEKDSEENTFNKEDLAMCMTDFFAAATMQWIVLYLTLYQDVQDRSALGLMTPFDKYFFNISLILL